MKTIWKRYEAEPRVQKALGDALGVTPVFGQLLVNRGIRTPEDAQSFLFGGIEACHDPFLMKDMEKAVGRIKNAVGKKEKILIYGDYDVDGVTSTALLADVLRSMGAECETFIPNRLEEGYGMNIRAVARAREDGVKLIITVDCGINSVEEVRCAAGYGIDVIITDHHEVKEEERPPAYAIIDPHQPECGYPFKFLAGVGVAYKLAKALLGSDQDAADRHLDLVALGTIADVAPLTGENRILAKEGMKKLRAAGKEGLKALMNVAGVDPEGLTCRHIGFALGPRINAMGRVGSANVALDLLLCEDRAEAARIAGMLDRENKNRQGIEKDILKQAIAKVESEVDLDNDRVIVLAEQGWHPGVIGIVSSRITEEYSKPSILIALDGEKGKGSGRAVDGFNLFEAISASSGHLVDFGGHAAACGVKIESGKVEDFRKSINLSAGDHFTEAVAGMPEITIDLDIPFSRVGPKLIRELDLLMPYGPGNPEPVFSTSGLKVKNPPRDIGRSGFKFLATCGSLTCEVITFKKNLVSRPRQGDIIDLAYTPSINAWNGIESVQLNIRDLEIL